MGVNSTNTANWQNDTDASVAQYNTWFRTSAPAAFQGARADAMALVAQTMLSTNDLLSISVASLRAEPTSLALLRMATAPPIARDRLAGLSGVSRGLVETLEEGFLPARMTANALTPKLQALVDQVSLLLDDDLLPWVKGPRPPTPMERERAVQVLADRACGAAADPIIRNAQEQRQLAVLEQWLTAQGYSKAIPGTRFGAMNPGTFAFRLPVNGTKQDGTSVSIPIDAVVQPRSSCLVKTPLLIEAKSAGDFANVNKRQKEEAAKSAQLLAAHGNQVRYILFLCGYFGKKYLAYEASSGIDWVWEHRVSDLAAFHL